MKLNILFCFSLRSIGESFRVVALLSTRDFFGGTISEARAYAGSGRASLEVCYATIDEAEIHRKNPRVQRDIDGVPSSQYSEEASLSGYPVYELASWHLLVLATQLSTPQNEIKSRLA